MSRTTSWNRSHFCISIFQLNRHRFLRFQTYSTSFKALFLDRSVQSGLVGLLNLSLAGDGTPVYTAARERKKRTCNCLEKGNRDCGCDRIYSQPDCNIGWDSHRECYYFGYDLYMLTASDSENDLPVFLFLGPASRHDSIGFLYNWFSMKQFLPEAHVTKLLLDSAHDAMPYYEYCRDYGIAPFIDLNADRGRPPVYKDDFTINDDGVPVCREGHVMRRDGTESAKGRTKFKCSKISFAGGNVTCTCENPCSDAKYGRTVHLVIEDNPRLFNVPPRSSREWKMEYNARTSAERCNKREKVDYKLEDGRLVNCAFLLKIPSICSVLDNIYFPMFSRLLSFGRQAQDSENL